MRDPKDINKQIQLEFSGSELGVRKALQTIIDGLVGGGRCQSGCDWVS
jgi:hypothetical protein